MDEPLPITATVLLLNEITSSNLYTSLFARYILPSSKTCSAAYSRLVASIPPAIPVAFTFGLAVTKKTVAFNSTPSAATTLTLDAPIVLSVKIKFSSL